MTDCWVTAAAVTPARRGRPSESADSIAAVARDIGRSLNGGLLERDRAGKFDADGWRRCAEAGVLGLAVPERFGGTGCDLPTVAAALEALGHGCRDNGLLFAMGAQMWSVQAPLLLFGTPEQQARFVPDLVAGRIIGAHAVTEPDAGSDVFSMRTTAREDGAHYVLDGSKTFITGAPLADLFLVVATTDPSLGVRGLLALLVARATPGLSVSPTFEKMGLRTSPLAEVSFSGCRVPREGLLGRPGGGSAVFGAAMEWERLLILAPAIGTMQRQLDDCVAHARSRRQFGQAIGRHQLVSERLVAMRMRLDLSRLLLRSAVAAKQDGTRMTCEPSQVKLQVSESWVQSSLDALQVHGAYGYMTESGVERDLRDALASRIYSGTSEMQKRIIAGFMGF